MLTLGTETVSPVHRHETFVVRGGGGSVQSVPWNLPADGNIHFSDGLGDGAVFGGHGVLTEDEKTQLATRIKHAAFTDDIQAILEIIPTVQERQEVATRAIAIGADPWRVQQALAGVDRSSSYKQLLKPWPTPVRITLGLVATLSSAASAYHGYRRNNSIGWAIWWGFWGGVFPIFTPAIGLAQGFGKPRRSGLGRTRRTNRRRSRRS